MVEVWCYQLVKIQDLDGKLQNISKEKLEYIENVLSNYIGFRVKLEEKECIYVKVYLNKMLVRFDASSNVAYLDYGTILNNESIDKIKQTFISEGFNVQATSDFEFYKVGGSENI